ncbi:hypothetical protein FFWV33_02300 [Flavobacterium faecale]|uniref:Lipocalin-like domain-containing protein n=1 Tax=Flavobacterium faecale TaxID=1355330 RepID=A0A2S1L9M7_9FLAO|nr:hypothetical protein [Flavobacterium faecale]AWG20441.1 hypothetical protein FFWV33_02300 [Flavobacterium faecale]
MKKVIYFLTLLLLTISCSDSSTDNSTNSDNKSFHPPTWIQSRWTTDLGGSKFGYNFKSNDVCTIINSTDNCFKAMLNIYKGTQAIISVNEEIISETEYKFSYTIQSFTQYYHFIKVSPTSIKESITDPNGNILYIKN